MLYPVYVYPGDATTAYAVEFPDFPGCHAASDTWEGLPAAIQEAAEAHFYDDAEPVPAPTPLHELAGSSEYAGGAWMLVDIDLSRIDKAPVRLNISLPTALSTQIDAYAAAHHMTRSGFLALAARKLMQEGDNKRKFGREK